jgi:hypothetical protein
MGRSRSSDLPTVPPPFNVARFARDSDAKVTVVPPGPAAPRELQDQGVDATDAAPQSEMRIATRPRMEAAETDEAWARTAVGLLVVAMSVDELKRLPLDHRAGYLLSRMDGSLDLYTLVEVAALPRRDVLRMVRDLVDSGVVAFR